MKFVMDLERIKQNLRLRSGRTKKLRKAPRPPPPTQTSQYTQTDGEPPNGRDDDVRRPVAATEDAKLADEQMLKPTEKQGEVSRGSDSSTELAHPNETKMADNMTTEQEGSQHTGSSHPRPQVLTRRSTRGSHQSISQKPTPQLLSSLMAGSSSSSEDHSSDEDDYDLRPPAPKPKPPSIEATSELLFSSGHLNTLLHHQPLLARFTSFLHRYRPDDYPLLMRYLETSKAIAAVEYANAVAQSTTDPSLEGNETRTAASLDKAFQTSFNAAFEALLNECLPLYVTYSLVKSVSDCLQNEIMGKVTPATRGLVGGLSEVFCLTDPKQPDNPIIYASEEFYRYTGFERDDVIGRNCRFLQGPKTQVKSPKRLKLSLDKGEEVCETLLNYRRDGRPFINLLMIAPLHDDKGNVKYHIGAQVDVSGLVEGGHGLEGFQRFREKQKNEIRRDEREAVRYGGDKEAKKKQKALAKLRDLSELFDLEESAVVVSHSRSASTDREDDGSNFETKQKRSRTFLVDSDQSDDEDEAINGGENVHTWELGQAGPQGLSGKLPGVYEKYLLIRPAPSLRIIFVSHKLQSHGKFVQSPFLSHVAAPLSTLRGLAENLRAGTPVSAKINLMPARGERREGTKINPGARHEDGKFGRACWMSATPLLGSDDQVGVWMIVIVERLKGRDMAERYASRPQGVFGRSLSESEHQGMTKQLSRQHSRNKAKDLPIKPIRIDSGGGTQTLGNYRHIPAAALDHHSSKADASARASGETDSLYIVEPQLVIRNGGRDRRGPTRSASYSLTSSSRRIYGSDSEDGDDVAKDNFLEARESLGSHLPDYLPADIPPNVPSGLQSPASEQIASKTPTGLGLVNREAEMSPTKSRRVSASSKSPAKRSPKKQSASPSSEKGAKRKDKSKDSLVYVDYLNHPDTSPHVERGRSKFKDQAGDSEGVSDPDCIRSPYSLD